MDLVRLARLSLSFGIVAAILAGLLTIAFGGNGILALVFALIALIVVTPLVALSQI